MHLSLIQRITIGFAIIILLVIAMASSAYVSQIKMAQKLELTSSTLTGLLDKSNTVLLHLQDANRAMMQHANTQPPEKRKFLRERYLLSKEEYSALIYSLKGDLKDYPELRSSLQQANLAANKIFNNAEKHINLHDNRITSREKALAEISNINDTWEFFTADFDDIADSAQREGKLQAVSDIRSAQKYASGALTILQRSLALATSKSAEKYETELKAYYASFTEKLAPVMSAIPAQAANIQYYQDEFNRAINLPLGVFQQQLNYLGFNDQSRILFEDTAQQMDQVNAELNNIVSGIRMLSGDALIHAEQTFKFSLLLNVVFALVSIVIALVIGITVVRAIRRPLADIMKALGLLSEGDLTGNIKSQYHSEMGLVVDNINLVINKQSSLIHKVQSAASSINTMAADSLAMSEQTNQDVANQRIQTDIVATAVTEMEAAVSEVASHASNTSDEVTKVTEQAEINMANMNLNLEFVSTLKASLDNASCVIQQLSTESLQIGAILNVIQGVAEQTNLLALNAAIEAARAGEHGRGFAVVADEVRSLATRTQKSATEISQMIGSLQGKANEAVAIVESNLEQADRSVNQTLATNSSLQEMLTSLNTINDMSSSIATASEQQSTVVREVAQNVVNIADMAEKIAQSAENSAKNSESLNQLSNEQSQLVAQFKLTKD